MDNSSIERPSLVWHVISNSAILSLRFTEEMSFPVIEVVRGEDKTTIKFLTTAAMTAKLGEEPPMIEIDTKQTFLSLDIDHRITERLWSPWLNIYGLTIPAISTSDFQKD